MNNIEEELINITITTDWWNSFLCAKNESIFDYNQLWNTSSGPHFSQCFLHTIPIWIPAAFLWLLTPWHIWLLYKSKKRHRDRTSNDNISIPIGYTWHNMSRTMASVAIVIVNVILAVWQLISYYHHQEMMVSSSSSLADITGSLINVFTFSLYIYLIHLHRYHGYHTSGLEFFFTLFSMLFTLPSVYQYIATVFSDDGDNNVHWNYTATLSAHFILTVILFGINCFADHRQSSSLSSTLTVSYDDNEDSSIPINVEDNDDDDNVDIDIDDRQTILPPPFGRQDSDHLRSTIQTHPTLKHPEEYVSFLSQLTFSWIAKLLKIGRKRPLKFTDLWCLPVQDQSETLFDHFQKYFDNTNQQQQQQQSSTLSSNIAFTSIYAFKWDILLMICMAAFDAALALIGPFLLKHFIEYISNPVEILWHGLILGALFFIIMTIQAFNYVHFIRLALSNGMQVKVSLINVVYRKAFQISSAARRSTNTGQIVNIMSVDANRISDIFRDIDIILMQPLMIIMATYLLYQELGASIFAGVTVLVVTILISAFCTRVEHKISTTQMAINDERVDAINEMLAGIRVIKLYGWEVPFISKINAIRFREIRQLRKLGYLNAFTSLIYECAPFLAIFLTFGIYLLSSPTNILDAKKAFVSLALFDLLRNPLEQIPYMLNLLVASMVSIRRLNRYLNAPELGGYVQREHDYNGDDIVIENGTFIWGDTEPIILSEDAEDDDDHSDDGGGNNIQNSNEEKCDENHDNDNSDEKHCFTLKSINLRIKKGSLLAIVGRVGSGKSSLLSAILGDMELQSGSVNIAKSASIAYVTQQAWIRNDTLRENILFGTPYNRERYEAVLNMCCLRPDIEQLPGGDRTEIGEKGINLSGGQKQRISIARACYVNADIILFDDPLSALDSHVAKEVFEKVLSNDSGYLRGRTRVLVTNALSILSDVDQIVVLANGVCTEIGTYQALMSRTESKFSQLIHEYSSTQHDNNMTNEMTVASEMMPANDGDHKSEIKRQYSIQSNHEKENDGKKDKDDQLMTTLIEEERAEVGQVKWSVYWNYICSLQPFWLCMICVGFIGMQIADIGTNVWLAIWSNDSINTTTTTTVLDGEMKDNDTSNIDVDVTLRNERLSVYGALGLAEVLLYFFGWLSLVNSTVKCSETLHHNLLDRIIRSPMQFFDTTPLGRIVNRFSKNMTCVDLEIPFTLATNVQILLQVLAIMCLIVAQMPIMLILIVPTLIVYYYILKYFISTNRQLSRLESISLSPIFSHFDETLNGVCTIRAYGSQKRFITEIHRHLDTNQRVYYPMIVANRWLSLYLSLCGNLILLFAILFAVYTQAYFVTRPGFVGLIITYSLNITNSLNRLARGLGQFEAEIVSVERINEYCNNVIECEWTRVVNQNPTLPIDWPAYGRVEFCNYSVRYRDGLDLVLKDLNFVVMPGEKIGIVGRTGAGKSSLTLALFRILEPARGKILIDNIDISQIGLHELRSKLAIIPQDPVLFSGTIRTNLDPFSQQTDQQLWHILELCHLKEFVYTLEAGLDYQVSENGENLSVGQRQLICLGRALLRQAKVLILDEATAAVDVETDSLIQRTIRNEFSHCTILTIAHRLHTIIDSTKVMVLECGGIAEYDSPQNLLANSQSKFYSLAKDAGIVG